MAPPPLLLLLLLLHIGVLSVFVRVQKQDVYLHPDLEFWMYTHCIGEYTDNFGSFGPTLYFANVKTSVWALTETLGVLFYHHLLMLLVAWAETGETVHKI